MKFVGVWMDHKEAHVTTFADGQQEFKKIKAPLERWHKATHGVHASMPGSFNGGGAEGKQDQRREHELHDYYKHLAQELAHADKILLMGPGLAKKEFAKFAAGEASLKNKIAEIETVDQMTDRQIAAETKKYFKIA